MRAGAMRRPAKWRPLLRAGLGLALCAALVGGAVTTATAAERDAGPAAGAAVLGGFAVGDGLEALIDERDGGLSFTIGLGGLALHWDSRRVGGAVDELGPGWGFGLMTIGTSGGVRMVPASGGVYEADASQPSGLLGYGMRDLVFTQAPPEAAPLEARADGRRGATPYAYTIEQLGGVTTYFDAHGRAIARVAATGLRADWLWETTTGSAAPPRLAAAIDERGVSTELDWRTPGVLTVRPGANLPGEAPVWTVDLGDDGVRAVTDPLGGVVDVVAADGLVSELAGPSGAVTRVTWSVGDDGVAHASRVRTTDASGRELSHRTWEATGGAGASGWPVVGQASLGEVSGYSTEVSDGATTVRSDYTARHLLRARAVVATDASGERVIQAQTMTYPDVGGDGAHEDGGGASALPVNWARPVSAAITHHDAAGASRTVSTAYAYDELGRVVRETAADGAVTETAYDDAVPADHALPVGLAERQTKIGSDGTLSETRHELNEQRTAIVASETSTGRVDGARERTGRVEYEVRPDGVVTEQRVYPSGDRSAAPAITRRTQSIDLGRGTTTVAETTAADTANEVTATIVAPLRSGGSTSSTDALGARTVTERDALGRLVSATDPAGLVTRVRYETMQRDGRNATVTTTPDGVALTQERDELGRETRLADNIRDGAAVEGHVRVAQTTAYPEPGTTAVTDAWGATTTTTADALGRPRRVELPSGLVQVVHHDDVAGTVTSWSSPTGDRADAEFVAVQHHDAAGRGISADGDRADGVVVPATATHYDGLGRRTGSIGDRLDERIEYDAFGRVAGSTLTPVGDQPRTDQPLAPVRTSNRYDGFGVGVEKTRSDGEHERSGGSRELDAQGLVRSETDQRGGVTSYDYAPDGRLERSLAPSGQETRHVYDPVTRRLARTTVTSPIGPTVTTAYAYDGSTGRLIGVSDPTADPADPAARTDVTYVSDAFGNTTEIGFGDGRSIRHRYDEHGRRISTTDAAGLTTVFAYDEIGQLRSATQHQGDAEAPVVARVGYTYDAYGRVSAVDRDSGATTRYTFTSMGDVASETTARGAVTLASREYTYTPGGDLASRVDRAADTSGRLAATTTVYVYDAFGRLRSSSRHDGEHDAAPVLSRTDYEVLVSGDVAAETITTDPGGPDEQVHRREFEYSPTGELIAITTDGRRAEQVFDAAGNLVVAADGTEYAYDAANRRRSRTSGDRTSLTTYWADGGRRARTEGATTTRFYSDGATLLTEEHAGHGAASYLVGAGRHARTVLEDGAEPATRSYDTDRHGNVVGLLDEAGQLVEQAAYSDYGVPTPVPATTQAAKSPAAPAAAALWRNPFGYAGEYTECDGTQPLGDRVYDPHQLRFQTEDVAARHNLYAFGALNPITNVDPTGRTELSDRAISWIGTGLGAAASIASIGMAIATAGWSLTLMGVIGIAAETAALGITVVQIIDEFVPSVLEGDTEQALDYAAIGLGFASFAAGGIATLDASNWASDLAIAERNYRGAVEWTQTRLRLHAAGEARIARVRALYNDAVDGVDSFGQFEEWQLLGEAMVKVRRKLTDATPQHSLVPVNEGVSSEALTHAGHAFLDALTGRPGMLLTPLRGPRVHARTATEIAQLSHQVSLARPRPDLVASARELFASAGEMLARAKAGTVQAPLRGRLGPSPSPFGHIPEERHWLYGPDPVADLSASGTTAGDRYPGDPVDGISIL